MALDESTDGLEKLDSNGVTAYIAPDLKKALSEAGEIHVDFQDNGIGARGFSIRVGEGGDCSSGGCDGCG